MLSYTFVQKQYSRVQKLKFLKPSMLSNKKRTHSHLQLLKSLDHYATAQGQEELSLPRPRYSWIGGFCWHSLVPALERNGQRLCFSFAGPWCLWLFVRKTIRPAVISFVCDLVKCEHCSGHLRGVNRTYVHSSCGNKRSRFSLSLLQGSAFILRVNRFCHLSIQTVLKID